MQFEAAYSKFYPALVGYASARLDEGMAEDLAQDAFMEAWKTWGMAQIENMRSYLITILRRCWFRHLRRGRPDTTHEIPEIAESDPDALAKIDAERALGEIRTMGLDGSCVEMQALGWRQDEIGAIMGVSGERVRQRINRAMERLAKKWKRAYGSR